MRNGYHRGTTFAGGIRRGPSRELTVRLRTDTPLWRALLRELEKHERPAAGIVRAALEVYLLGAEKQGRGK